MTGLVVLAAASLLALAARRKPVPARVKARRR